MSTPSTATATTLYPHQTHYGHSHYQTYQSNASQHTHEAAIGAAARLGPPYGVPYTNITPSSSRHNISTSSRQPAPSNSKHSSQSVSKMDPEKGKRGPDWSEFYKNGVPKEVIVIDDTPPPPPSTASAKNSSRMANGTTQVRNAANAQHMKKKRRTEQGQDVAHGSYDNVTPQYAVSDSNTTSLDRTTSLQTTATTSLGSHGSTGASGYNDTQTTGQKRKRVTRQATSSDKKKKEAEGPFNSPFSSYVPPRRPPIKATEVAVRPIKEVIQHSATRVDDDDGHYVIVENSDLSDRYQILRLLGQGTFGKVVEAYDKRNRSKCAIKIIRSVQKYRDASRIELRVLSTLAQNDRDNRNKCIHLRDCFDFRNHICIVTDLLGQSVFDFLKANAFVPFPSSQIQNFARQLLTSVAFLHDLNLVHTDLKPENILLYNNSYQTFTYNKTIPSSSATQQRTAHQRRVLLDTDIRLIDFGSATFDDEYHSSVVSTRHYRAPEIILQLGWSYPCDMWSVGCILVEFYTGDALFQTHDNLEHLAMMEMVCSSKVDPKIVRSVLAGRGSNNSASKFFRGKDTKLDYPNKDTTKASKSYVKAMKPLSDIIPCHTNTSQFNQLFFDLLKKIFVYDPNKRITAKEALKHPWFQEGIVDDGTEAIRIRRARHEQDQAQAQAQAQAANSYR